MQLFHKFSQQFFSSNERNNLKDVHTKIKFLKNQLEEYVTKHKKLEKKAIKEFSDIKEDWPIALQKAISEYNTESTVLKSLQAIEKLGADIAQFELECQKNFELDSQKDQIEKEIDTQLISPLVEKYSVIAYQVSQKEKERLGLFKQLMREMFFYSKDSYNVLKRQHERIQETLKALNQARVVDTFCNEVNKEIFSLGGILEKENKNLNALEDNIQLLASTIDCFELQKIKKQKIFELTYFDQETGQEVLIGKHLNDQLNLMLEFLESKKGQYVHLVLQYKQDLKIFYQAVIFNEIQKLKDKSLAIADTTAVNKKEIEAVRNSRDANILNVRRFRKILQEEMQERPEWKDFLSSSIMDCLKIENPRQRPVRFKTTRVEKIDEGDQEMSASALEANPPHAPFLKNRASTFPR